MLWVFGFRFWFGFLLIAFGVVLGVLFGCRFGWVWTCMLTVDLDNLVLKAYLGLRYFDVAVFVWFNCAFFLLGFGWRLPCLMQLLWVLGFFLLW